MRIQETKPFADKRSVLMADQYPHPSLASARPDKKYPREALINERTLLSLPMVIAIISLAVAMTQMFTKNDATSIQLIELKADFKDFKKEIKEDMKTLNINQLRLENAVKHGR